MGNELMPDSQNIVQINRAPVLTLWAAVVAKRLGFTWDEALSLGKAVAGLNAQSKGRRLGIFTPPEAMAPAAVKKARQKKRGETMTVELLGRAVPVVNTEDGLRSVNKDRPVTSESVEKYLAAKFGDDLDRVRQAMEALANAHTPAKLAEAAFGLYEEFRPAIPAGVKGWGAKGELDLGRIRGMGR